MIQVCGNFPFSRSIGIGRPRYGLPWLKVVGCKYNDFFSYHARFLWVEIANWQLSVFPKEIKIGMFTDYADLCTTKEQQKRVNSALFKS